jgi:uncharacterized damage-inducible protein DinB
VGQEQILRELFEFNDWANRRILALLGVLSNPVQRPLDLLAHLLTAEEIWLMRLRGQDTVGVDKSPKLTVVECESLLNEHKNAFAKVVDEFESRGLDSQVTYRTLSGREFTTSASDILTHIVQHGTYHRGQIALALRAEEIVPVDTDFITFVRARSELTPATTAER